MSRDGDESPSFGAWLRTELLARGLSQRGLARASGVDPSTISRLVRGARMPSLQTARRLSGGLARLRVGPDDRASGGDRRLEPRQRLELALRADEALSDADVNAVMGFYDQVRG